MRFALDLAFILLLTCIVGCGKQPTPPAAGSSRSNPAAADLAGYWAGEATIIVQWARQEKLPVDLRIEPDGQVSGTVGDAKLVDGRLRRQKAGSPFRVHGKLEGNLIDAEAIRRDSVDVLFHVAEDGTLAGGVHSGGSKFGGKDSMKLSASKMVLRRVDPAPATDHATGSSARASEGQ